MTLLKVDCFLCSDIGHIYNPGLDAQFRFVDVTSISIVTQLLN